MANGTPAAGVLPLHAQEGAPPDRDTLASGATTFPRLLQQHARERPQAPALREKDFGIWQTLTWQALHEMVARIAAGLHADGCERGEHVVLIGRNRPRLYATMIAVQALGAVPVPLYEDAVADEVTYVFQDAEVRRAVVEDQEQVDKLLDVRAAHPMLTRIIYDEPRGLRDYDDPAVMDFSRLEALGVEALALQPDLVSAQIAAGRPEDPAAMFYTSGTTGRPKGVVHGHRNLITMAATGARMEGLGPDEDVLAYLPVAWIGQNIFSYAQWLVCGFTVNCPESAETVVADQREIGPTYFFAPPRVLEQWLTQVTIRMEDAGRVQRWMFNRAMAVARRSGARILDGAPGVTLTERLAWHLWNACIYGPLRNMLGMSRIRVAYTAGEAIGPELFAFYRSLGINLKQLYGSTETAVFVCVQPDGQVHSDTVGVPVAGVEVRIAESGEVQIRSPGLLQGYWRNPAATAEVLTADGWYHTGDAGYFGPDRHLRIIDRAKDVGRLTDGSLFAPKYLENRLKFYPWVREAVAFGAGTDQVVAFINIDQPAVADWAERRGIPYAGYADLAGKPEVLDLIATCVAEVNAALATDPMMAASQIRRFLVLHKELDADDGELTRTRKVRRAFVAERYAVLVDALHQGLRQQYVETPVRFEDGRTGMVAAELQLRDATAYPAIRGQAA